MKNWTLSVNQWLLQTLNFSVYLIDLLNILLRYNAFSGIQNAVVDWMAANHRTMTITFFWCNLALGSAFELLLSSTTELASHHQFLYKIHFCGTSQSQRILCSLLHRVREDDISKRQFFLIFSELMRHPLIELFHLSNLLQMPNEHRMVDVEFFSNFSCSCDRISFDDALSWFVVNFRWPATTLLIFKAHLLCETS